MRVLHILLLVLLITGFSRPGLHAENKIPAIALGQERSAIINGSTASVANYPWMAFLADENGEQYCGASLISTTWILTAAHCFLNEESTAVDIETGARSNVFLNTDTVSPTGPNAIQGAIGQIIVHPSYQPDEASSPNANDFDIALVELTAAVNQQPVLLLAANAAEIQANTAALIMGWGSTAVNSENESIDPSNSLLQANQRIVDFNECAAVYGDSLTGNMLCAGGLDSSDTSDTCQGDSGGPLLIAKGVDFVQVGIVSFGGAEGPSCGDPDAPGVYAKVAALTDFILQHATGVTFTTLESSPTAPQLNTSVTGNSVTLSWTGYAGATGYILYYAPYPSQSPIGSLDVGSLTSLSGDLASGSAFYVAVQPYNSNGPIEIFSNVAVFTVE